MGVIRDVQLAVAVAALVLVIPASSSATSQWARKTEMACSGCHTVFPRLNSFGDQYLRDGYQLESERDDEKPAVPWLNSVNHLLGFRVNLTPVRHETNVLKRTAADSTDLQGRWTLGSPHWLQMFVAGSIYRDISFFTELEMAQSSFKFNWFYFNFTNLLKSQRALNLQIGNISPLEFTSYPNRLPQLPALKSTVMLEKASAGTGEVSVDMSSARPGIQYYGHNNWALLYAGVSPGPTATNGTQKNQFLQTWTGLVLKMPGEVSRKLEGSTVTAHYYAGVDTKNTGAVDQATNRFTRVSPQLNLRYNENLDVQAAWVYGEESNRGLVIPAGAPLDKFIFRGIGVEAGYMPKPQWHIGAHYDWYESGNKLPSGAPVIEDHRIVPAATYIVNENIRGTIYWEHSLKATPPTGKVETIYLNMRTMF